MKKNQRLINLQIREEQGIYSLLKKQIKSKLGIPMDIEDLVIKNGEIVSLKLKEINEQKDLFQILIDTTEKTRSVNGDIKIKENRISTYATVGGYEFCIWADKSYGYYLCYQDFLLDYEQLMEDNSSISPTETKANYNKLLTYLKELGVHLVYVSKEAKRYENLVYLKINANFLEVAEEACTRLKEYDNWLGKYAERCGFKF